MNEEIIIELKRLERENKALKKQIESDKGLITVGGKQQYQYLQRIDELEQENKALNFKINQLKANGLYNDLTGIELSAKVVELEQENNAYKQSEQEATEIIKELKEYSQRMENQRENYYKEYNKYRSALEEIRNYCDRIEQGSVIGTQDCLINSIKNITNEVLQ